MTALGLLFHHGNPAPDPFFLFLFIRIQLACFAGDTFDPDIEVLRGRTQSVVCCGTVFCPALEEHLVGELTLRLEVLGSVSKAGG